MRPEHKKHMQTIGPCMIPQGKGRAGQAAKPSEQGHTEQPWWLVPGVEGGTQMPTALIFSDSLKELQAIYNAIHYFKRPKEYG